MSQFISAIALKSGDVVCDPEHTDHYHELIAVNNLQGGRLNYFSEEFCRVIYYNWDDITDLDAWQLEVNEDFRPTWWKKHEDKAKSHLRQLVKQMFIK